MAIQPSNRSSRSHGDFVQMQRQAATRDIGAELRSRHRSRVLRTRWSIGVLVVLAVALAVVVALLAR